MHVVGIAPHGGDGMDLSFGHEYLLTDSDHLISVGAANSAHSQSSTTSPTSTLVGSSTGLEINLIWDSSVRSSANQAAIEAAVVTAAQVYTETFSNHVVINIAVGYGEINGSTMNSNALGESESYGFITNYSTIQSALNTADASLIRSGLESFNALSADNPPTTGNFFVTSAEAKALGLVSHCSTAIDGYIGISSSSSLVYFPANGGTIGKSQFDGVGIAAHEISEVMGRIGLEGGTLGTYMDVYTPLDLFRYEAPNVRDLTPTPGYFSINGGSGGATNLNTYNDPQNGGDAADWASASIGASNAVVHDSYDAYGTPGIITNVSPIDILEDAVLGYKLTSGLPAKNIVA